MISFYDSQIVAYSHPEVNNGHFYCPDCWRTPGDTERDNEIETEAEVIRYSAEEYAEGEGLYCEDCGQEIVAPFYDEESGDEDAFLEPDIPDSESIYQEGERDGELPLANNS